MTTQEQLTPAQKYQNAITAARKYGHTHFTCSYLPQSELIGFYFFGGTDGGYDNFVFGGDEYFMHILAEGFIEEGFKEGNLTVK